MWFHKTERAPTVFSDSIISFFVIALRENKKDMAYLRNNYFYILMIHWYNFNGFEWKNWHTVKYKSSGVYYTYTSESLMRHCLLQIVLLISELESWKLKWERETYDSSYTAIQFLERYDTEVHPIIHAHLRILITLAISVFIWRNNVLKFENTKDVAAWVN